MNNKREISGFFKKLLILWVVISALQFLASYLMYETLPESKHLIGHGFILAMTFFGYLIFVRLKGKFPEYTAYIFSGISIGKMLLTAIFLLPFILKPFEGRVFFVLQFMTIYMVYLFVEVSTLLKNMKDSPA